MQDADAQDEVEFNLVVRKVQFDITGGNDMLFIKSKAGAEIFKIRFKQSQTNKNALDKGGKKIVGSVVLAFVDEEAFAGETGAERVTKQVLSFLELLVSVLTFRSSSLTIEFHCFLQSRLGSR